VLEMVRLRFSAVERKDFIDLHHYTVAKIQGNLTHLRGVQKEDLAVKIIALLIKEVASEEVKTFYAQSGGDMLTRDIIKALCIAGNFGKAHSKGV